MFDRFSRQIQYAIFGFAAGGVLVVFGLIGEAVVKASPIPSVLVVPFHWIGQVGATILIAGAVILCIRLALLFG